MAITRLTDRYPDTRVLSEAQRIEALEARVAQLEQALQIGSTGAVTLKSTSKVIIESGGALLVKAMGALDIVSYSRVHLKAPKIEQN